MKRVSLVRILPSVLAGVWIAYAAVSHAGSAEKYLFIWAGDQARKNPDFLAVINFDQGSKNYGKVITAVPLPEPGATSNEPHHVGLSQDGNILACGGLLSVLKGQKEVFFFDVSHPETPKLVSAADPPQSAITDEFLCVTRRRISGYDDGRSTRPSPGKSRRVRQGAEAGC